MTGFNLAITALPPFFLAIFERDVNEDLIQKVSCPQPGGRSAPTASLNKTRPPLPVVRFQYPESYMEVRNGLWWNRPTQWMWFTIAIWHSLGTLVMGDERIRAGGVG